MQVLSSIPGIGNLALVLLLVTRAPVGVIDLLDLATRFPFGSNFFELLKGGLNEVRLLVKTTFVGVSTSSRVNPRSSSDLDVLFKLD